MERAVEFLMQLHPMPLTKCNWARGWVDKPLQSFKALAKLRNRSNVILYQKSVMDIGTLESDIAHLREYAHSLRELIDRERLPSREYILCFDWSFPAESRKPPKAIEDVDNMMDMRSAYVAFEYMCVSISYTIMSFKVAKLTHDMYQGDVGKIKRRYLETAEYLQELQDEFCNVFSQAQLSSLRNQGLPIQMQFRWVSFFRAHVQYKLVSFSQPDNLYLIKISAQQYAKSALEWLRDPALSTTQTAIAQCAYDYTLMSYTRQNIRWHCKEAELAELEVGSAIAYTIIKRAFVMIDRMSEPQQKVIQEIIDQCKERIKGIRQMCLPPAPESEMYEWWTAKGYDLHYCQ